MSPRSRKPRRLSDFTPAPWNPREISPDALAALAESLRRFGDLSGFVLNERTGTVICGHQRRACLSEVDLSALEHGPAHVVTLPAGPGTGGKPLTSRERTAFVRSPSGARFSVRVVNWPPALERAANVAANSPELQGEFRPEELAQVLEELRASDAGAFDALAMPALASSLGITLGEVAKPGLTEPDAIPEPPGKAKTRRGDVYALGDHRLCCGDSADAKDLDRLLSAAGLAAGDVALVVTDPPYNVGVQPGSNNAVRSAMADARKHKHRQAVLNKADPGRTRGGKARSRKLRPRDRALANDNLPPEEYAELLRLWFGNAARVLRPGGAVYVWGGYTNHANYPPAFDGAGLYLSQVVVWHKCHAVLTRKDFMGDHESAFYGWRKGGPHWFNPEITSLPDVWEVAPELANPTDFWKVKKIPPQSMRHLTEKPVELARRSLKCSSRTGEVVLDLFGGSGFLLIAAEQLGRRALLLELDPLYCDVIVERWEAFAGKRASRKRRRKT